MRNPILPNHVNRLIELASPSLSPDGAYVVYVRREVDARELKERSWLVRQALPGTVSDAFTAGTSDSAPVFSPDGKQVAFLRPDEKGKKQIHLIASAGGEARRLTSLPWGVRGMSWAPSGSQVVVSCQVTPDGSDAEPRSLVVNRIRYRDDGDGWRGDAFTQLFCVDAATGHAERLTTGDGNHEGAVYSPDGTRIAFVCDAVEGRDFNRGSQIRVMPADGGDSVVWSEGLSRVGSAAWSPDGSRLVAAGTHDGDIWDPRQSWIYVLEEGRAARRVSDDAYTVVQPLAEKCWSEEGWIHIIGDRAGESFLCRAHADGETVEPLVGGARVLTQLTVNADVTRAAAITQAPDCPCEVAVFEVPEASVTVATSVNVSFAASHDTAPVEKLTFHRGGETLQARVLFPPGFDASARYPLVLDIHGGPNGRFSDNFDITHQVLVGAGAVVLTVNPRGSTSYGPEFMKAVLRDWGGEDFLDLMAGVDALCERPYVDRGRLGVHGYSYGGFMSSWIVGHDHRFRAAVVGAPCINLHSMYGTSDIGVSFGENQWGGSSLDPAHVLLERSPLTYAKDVRTPVLLMHGEEDYRCPIEQSEQFYVALKRQEKTVQFVRFPGGSHGFRKSGPPQFRSEYLDRMVQWFREHGVL